MTKKVLISLLLMVSGVSVYAADIVTNTHNNTVSYEIVIDSGSSGNRVYIYKKIKLVDSDIPDIQSIQVAEIQGLNYSNGELIKSKNSIPLAGNDINMSIKPLLELAKANLEKKVNPSDVPVSVLATAGMRILEEEDKQKGTSLVADQFEKVKKVIKEEGFKEGKVGIIPGYDEGLYSWLDVNYKALKKAIATNGIIEIGGASAQIAFTTATTQQQIPTDAKITTFNLNGKLYNVFSISYLGLGQNMARKYMNNLAANVKTRDQCYPTGYTNIQEPLLFPEFLFSGSSFSGHDSTFTVKDSKYSFSDCANNYQNVLSMPLFNSLAQIKEIGGFKSTTFMGLASIYWRFENFGLASTSALDVNTFENKVKGYCSSLTLAPEASAKYEYCFNKNSNHAKDSEYASIEEKNMCNETLDLNEKLVNCANAAYIYEFLGKLDSSFLSVNTTHLKAQDIGSASTGTWTRGFVIDEIIQNHASATQNQ
ncbi:MAG: hypothetical protein K0R14_1162 [Burkholderiales bacterium]|nr:hypothetical protein [Burkholderiales bacterium]